MLKFKKGHKTIYGPCNTRLVPKKPKSFSWGFLLEFLRVTVLAKTISYLYNNIVLNFLQGGLER